MRTTKSISQQRNKYRDGMILWMLGQARIQPKACKVSHRTRTEYMSPLSITTFNEGWHCRQFDRWYAIEYPAQSRNRSYHDGTYTTNWDIGSRPQTSSWDITMAKPLKIVQEALLGQAEQAG